MRTSNENLTVQSQSMCSRSQLTVLLLAARPAIGGRVGVFSYGSGAACTMYAVRVRGEVSEVTDKLLLRRLGERAPLSPAGFGATVERYAHTYARFGWTPRVRGAPEGPAFCLLRVDGLGRRLV